MSLDVAKFADFRWKNADVTWFIHFLDLPLVRYNCAKFHHCRICVADFKEGAKKAHPHPWAAPKKLILNRVKGNEQLIVLRNPQKSSINVLLMKILKSTVTKKVIVCFYKLSEENFSKYQLLRYLQLRNSFIWNPSKVQSSLFERIACLLCWLLL